MDGMAPVPDDGKDADRRWPSGLGLDVHSTSIVLNRECSGPYRIDFLDE